MLSRRGRTHGPPHTAHATVQQRSLGLGLVSHAFLAAVRSRGAHTRTWCILRSHEIVYAYAWGRAKRN